jgi:hypothetical protein
MGLNQTGIANQALAGIGDKVIQDIDLATDPRARIIKNIFEQSIREIGAMADWRCLTERVILGPDLGNVPPFYWDEAYRLPSNHLRTIRVNGYTPGAIEDYYAEEGRWIKTNAGECYLVYVAYNTDTTIFDDLFTRALVTYLESKISLRFRQDEALAASKLKEFEDGSLAEARKGTANEQKKETFDITKESRWATRGNTDLDNW